MAYIHKLTTLEDVRRDAPTTIYYGFRSCWWTHRNEDLRTIGNEPGGLPCDPRGGVLMEQDAETFLADAEANPDHYGKHGLEAFISAHNDNCVVSKLDPRNTCLASWDEYNELIDQQRRWHGKRRWA